MLEVMSTLLELQTLEFNETTGDDKASQIAALRTRIPPPILGHYDRLVARGKKGVAAVRGQVCAGCHMRLPIGTVNTLMKCEDIQLCDSCGRYLYMAEVAEVAEVAAAPVTAAPEVPVKPARKPRKRKVLENAV